MRACLPAFMWRLAAIASCFPYRVASGEISVFADEQGDCSSSAAPSSTDSPGAPPQMSMIQRHITHRAKRKTPLVSSEAASSEASKAAAITGETASLDDSGFRKVHKLKSKYQMTVFCDRVLKDLRLKVVHEDAYSGYIFSLIDGRDLDFSGIQWMLNDQAQQPCGWVAKSKRSKVDGWTAPLTQQGLEEVADLRNRDEITHFILRVVESENFWVRSNGGAFLGFLDYYNCEKGFQTLDKLRDDIKSQAAAGKGWLHIKDGKSLKELEAEEEQDASPQNDHSHDAVVPAMGAANEQIEQPPGPSPPPPHKEESGNDGDIDIKKVLRNGVKKMLAHELEHMFDS